MRSPWTVVHLFLASAMAMSLLLLWTGASPWKEHTSRAAQRGTQMPASPAGTLEGIQLERIQLEASREPGLLSGARNRAHSAFVLLFPAPMVEEEQVGFVQSKGPARLEPECELLYRWRDRSSLEFRPMRGFAPATRYELLFEDNVRSLDGRAVPPRPGLQFETARLDLQRVRIGAARAGRVELHLDFDSAVSSEQLRKHLSLLAPSSRDNKSKDTSSKDTSSNGTQEHPLSSIEDFTLRQRDPHHFSVSFETPDRQLPLFVRVHLREGLVPEGGQLPTLEPEQHVISLRAKLGVRSHNASSDALRVEFSHHIEWPAEGSWRFEPALAGQVVKSYGSHRFLADFPPGTSMALVLEKGFPGRGRARLQQSVRLPFLVPDRAPEASFAGKGRQFSSQAVPQLTLHGCNSDKVELRLYRAYDNNAVFVASQMRDSRYGSIDSQLFAPPITKTLRLQGERNERVHQTLDLRKLLGEHPRGVYVAELWHPNNHWHPTDRTTLQFSDLGVSVRSGQHSALVRVHRLASGEARVGARVRILTRSNQELATARTDASGVAQLRWSPELKDGRPFLIEAEDGSDRSIVDFSTAATRNHSAALQDAALRGREFVGPQELEAWCHTDRGVMRPGETMHATVLVRDGAARVPVGREFELLWKSPADRIVKRETLPLQGDGLLASSCPSTSASPTGSWSLEVREKGSKRILGSTNFQVEMFVPDQIQVDTSFEGKLSIGKPASLKIRADWLTGGAAAGLGYRVWLRFDERKTEVAGFEGYSFDAPGQSPAPGALDSESGTLDANGEATVRFVVPGIQGRHASLAARLRVEIQQPSGRPVRAFASSVAWREALLGLRVSRSLEPSTKNAKPVIAELVLCDPEGRVLEETRTASLQIELCSWDRKLQRDSSGRLHWKTQLLRELLDMRDVSLDAGRARIALQAPETSWYAWPYFVASSEELHSGAQIGSTPQPPGTVRIARVDESSLEAGDRVRLTLESPMAGQAWVTLETDEPVASQSFAVEPGQNQIELALPADIRSPNVHAVATVSAPLHDPEHPGDHAAAGPRWALGVCTLPLQHASRRGKLEIEAPAELLPRSELEIALRARGLRRATVAIVDEGVLRVTRHPSPRPLQWFGASRRMATRGCDTGPLLRSELRFPKEIGTGGDADALSDFLSDPSGPSMIRNLALWSGDVRFGDDGRAQLRFGLPEFEGKLRIIAIGSGPEHIATAEHELFVRAPISLQLATPRLLGVGDRSTCVLTVRNLSGESGLLRVQVEELGALRLAEDTPRSFERRLEHEESARIELPLVAGMETGVHELRLHAQMRCDSGEEHERHLQTLTRVRQPMRFEHEFQSVVSEGRHEIPLSMGWHLGSLQAELSVGASFAMQLRPALQALIRYPYGCVEQTTSRAYALLAVHALAPELWPEGSGPDVRGHVRTAIDRLFSMMHRDGSLGSWPSSRRANLFGTLYAFDFFLEAEAAGFELPHDSMQRMRSRVTQLLGERHARAYRSYAAALLTRAGQPMLEHVRSWALDAEAVDERAMLAHALVLCGQPAEALELLRRPKGKATPRTLGGYLRSGVRTLALEARAWHALDPDAPETIERVQELFQRARDPNQLTTQELAQIAVTLGAVLRTSTREGFHPKGTLIVGDQRLPFDGASTLSFEWPESGKVVLETEGKAYAMLALRGYKTMFSSDHDLGLRMERKIYDVRSGKLAERFVLGHVYEMRFEGHARRPLANLLFMDQLPAGFEIENERLGAYQRDRNDNEHVDRVEYRDDRVLLFSTRAIEGKFTRSYRVRAVFAGSYSAPGAVAEALYQPGAKWSEGGMHAGSVRRTEGTGLTIEPR
jgi:uncharacterized protein YfaS (alpha-2-macroglobulin family)